MLHCRDITDRADGYLDGRLPFWERVQVRLHAVLCKHCNSYLHQLSLTIGALKAMGENRAPQAVDDTVQRILMAMPQPTQGDQDASRARANVVIYTTSWCPYCRAPRRFSTGRASPTAKSMSPRIPLGAKK